MVTSHRAKTIDKQELCRKVTVLLKKQYHSTPTETNRPVLETLLYAICLEDTTAEVADAAFNRLVTSYPDLNEARVSSVYELQVVFEGHEDAPWRALRVKNLLQFTFDQGYTFELESLKKKTVELASNTLEKIPSLSWFVRGWSLQHSLGSHVLPLDSRMHAALAWMGFTDPETEPEQTSDSLRPHIRKADAPLFCHLLHCLSIDPRKAKAFYPHSKSIEYTGSPDDGVHRLEVLLTKGASSVPKPTVPRVPPEKPVVKPEPVPEPVKVEAAKPESSKPAGKGDKPDVSKVETAKADGSKNDAAKQDAAKGSTAKTAPSKTTGAKEDHKPADSKPSKDAPKTSKAEAPKSDSNKGETHKSESHKADAHKADSHKSETSKSTAKADYSKGDASKGESKSASSKTPSKPAPKSAPAKTVKKSVPAKSPTKSESGKSASKGTSGKGAAGKGTAAKSNSKGHDSKGSHKKKR